MLAVAQGGPRRCSDRSGLVSTVGGVIGMTDSGLAMKLHRRKDRPQGDVLVRPCSCARTSGSIRHIPGSLCPTHRIWPEIERFFLPGAALFPQLTQGRLRSSLREALVACGVPRGEAFGLHCFRRGAARSILERGGSLADVLRAGSWSSGAYRSYLDLSGPEAQTMHDVLADASDSE